MYTSAYCEDCDLIHSYCMCFSFVTWKKKCKEEKVNTTEKINTLLAGQHKTLDKHTRQKTKTTKNDHFGQNYTTFTQSGKPLTNQKKGGQNVTLTALSATLAAQITDSGFCLHSVLVLVQVSTYHEILFHCENVNKRYNCNNFTMMAIKCDL